MAIYSSLPVYKDSYALTLELFAFTRTFPREYKYTLGERIKNQSLDLITRIYDANAAPRAVKHRRIGQVRRTAEQLRLLLRLCFDLKLCQMKTFIRHSDLLETVSKQLTAWQKHFTPRENQGGSTAAPASHARE